jgi:hypothetical protein
MTLLDLQDMEWTDDQAHGGDSDLSVVCEIEGGSSLSVALCDVD